MPFITEEIYSLLPLENKAKSIHISYWPEYREEWEDKNALLVGAEIVKIIQEVRKYKSEKQLSMRAELKKLSVVTKQDLTLAENDLLRVTNAENFDHQVGEFSVRIE